MKSYKPIGFSVFRIPLPIEEIRSKSKSSPATNENPWGDDLKESYNYTESAEPENDDPDSDGNLITEETVINDFDELLYIAPKKQCLSDSHDDSTIQVAYHVTNDDTSPSLTAHTSYTTAMANTSVYPTGLSENVSFASATEAEQKLQTVINNMECVLRQSQDCLKAVQQQKETFKQEMLQKSNNINLQTDMLQKVHILLEGLYPEQRNKAERKILQFLCECQIKILNNQEISDVTPVNIY